MSNLFCFGLGYTATYLKKIALQHGWSVAGTHRYQGPYILNHYIPLENPNCLLETTHILISIPPDEEGDDPALLFHREHIANLPKLQWVGVISSTGVYGDHQGGWVDETTAPITHKRFKAENKWRALDIPLHIFRLAALYGSGRSVLERIQADQGQIIDKPGHYFSRIHVEDIANILWHSMRFPTPGECYNLADDYPCSQREVMEYAYQLLQLRAPLLISHENPNISPAMRQYYLHNRRINNKKVKEQLGITLRYPSYREGLCQILEEKYVI